MRSSLICCLLLLCPALFADDSLHRYLYLSTPDGAQSGGSDHHGILVFDIDQGHRFVRRIDIPGLSDIRGFCGNAKNHAVYYSTTSLRLGAFDIEKDQVIWDRRYEAGCDRACITPDGKTIYSPTGWWWKGTNSGFLVIDAASGDVTQRIPVGPMAHNSLVSLDGRWVYLGTETTLSVFSTQGNERVRQITPVGESGVFPFTIDSRNRYAYVCLGKHVGFDVVDLRQSKVLHRVQVGEPAIAHRTHGAGLTPDEKELWISDQDGKKLFAFDNTVMPPTLKTNIALSAGGHGWITFSMAGDFAWCHTSDIIDARTKQVVTHLKDDQGKEVSSSKFIEVHFRNGKVVAMGDQFGLGRAPVPGR